ncbi:MAG: NAD-dependent epimerase/dehydratase family protein [Candidatus Aenigmarchaeota archaeon]
MKILVTGGAGFIGSHLIDSLIEKNHDLIVLDNLEHQVHGNRKPDYFNKDAKFIKGDVKNKKDWFKALKGVEIVIHLAASVGINQSMYRPSQYLQTNTIGTSNLYEVLLEKKELRNNIRKIIIPGSKTVYGEGTYKCKKCGIIYPELRKKSQLERSDWEIHCPSCNGHAEPVGTKEDKPVNPLSVYAISKYDTERIALNFGSVLKIPTFVFRGFSIYGPRQSLSNPYSGVCSIFLNRLKNKKQPIVFEDGKQLRDYIFIDDVKEFIIKVVENSAYGTYNLGTGKPVSVLQIADTLIEILGSDIKPKMTGEYRAGDNRHDFADMSKTQKDINFKARRDIRKGLEKLIGWGETQKTKDTFDKSERLRKRYLG